MTEKDEDNRRSYCKGTEMRRALADALESSGYMEQSVRARLSRIELRGPGDHYSSPA